MKRSPFIAKASRNRGRRASPTKLGRTLRNSLWLLCRGRDRGSADDALDLRMPGSGRRLTQLAGGT